MKQHWDDLHHSESHDHSLYVKVNNLSAVLSQNNSIMYDTYDRLPLVKYTTIYPNFYYFSTLIENFSISMTIRVKRQVEKLTWIWDFFRMSPFCFNDSMRSSRHRLHKFVAHHYPSMLWESCKALGCSAEIGNIELLSKGLTIAITKT